METAALIEFLLLLLIAASLIAMATIRLKIPYTVALVVGGFLIDLFHFPIVEKISESTGVLTPEVIMMLFLPALLFEAGINIHVRHLRENLVPILLFAVFGVVSATLVHRVRRLLGHRPSSDGRHVVRRADRRHGSYFRPGSF